MRIAVLDDYQSVALTSADWSQVRELGDVHVFTEPFSSGTHVERALRSYDVVVAMRERLPFPAEVLASLPALRLLVTTGMKNRAIDLAKCRELGITVCGTGPSPGTTSELAWALVLTASRRLDIEISNVRNGRWITTLGRGLRGQTLGVVGLGRLGAEVAQFGAAFGMDIVAWSENLTQERCAEVGARLVSKEQLFATADVVTLHLVLSERTRGIVGEPELRAMSRHAWLVNTSRGPLCDEGALIRACREGWIAGAALDVFDQEPLPAEHPFRTLENVIATPHMGYATEETYRAFYSGATEAILAWHSGRPVRVLAEGSH